MFDSTNSKNLRKDSDTNMIYINGIPNNNIKYRKSKVGHRFCCVTLPCPKDENGRPISLNGVLTISPNGRIIKNHSRPNTHKNLALGEANAYQTASILVDDGRGPIYKKVKIKNCDLYTAFVEGAKARTEAYR